MRLHVGTVKLQQQHHQIVYCGFQGITWDKTRQYQLFTTMKSINPKLLYQHFSYNIYFSLQCFCNNSNPSKTPKMT